MQEAGKKKMETQLPHLWNPHKIKKIRHDETEIQNINLGGTCTRRVSPLGRKHLALAGRDMCGKIPHSDALSSRVTMSVNNSTRVRPKQPAGKRCVQSPQRC